MAKWKPTVQQLESALGYGVEPAASSGHRVYSDLTPVPDGVYERTEREYREMRRLQKTRYRENPSAKPPMEDGESQAISDADNTVTVTRSSLAGFYKFFVDIQYGFGLHIPFLLTEAEANSILHTAKLCQTLNFREDQAKCIAQQPHPEPIRYNTHFLGLPPEIREKIYVFAFKGSVWRTEERRYNVCQAIGDFSGFLIPFGDDYTLLRVNKQIRQEALPLAYRYTAFHLADIEDVTRLLVAVGRVGRQNIEALEFAWESAVDHDLNWRRHPESETNHLILPSRHVPACVQLLKQCGRLRSLRLKFESYMMEDVPEATFLSDPGLSSLCSIQVERIEIMNPDDQPLNEYSIAQWLKSEMTR
ncbi:hypothetical protein HRG_001350 [Hirsutella rhossiliensis]|uniref:Uncharacterized protein n=1 Tax=Hirsutella rhossiliensis TaxID=111463 RepID=A0A9P8N584_9HYPO|nr:uncharacterized protein HRG_01350 [Hirsutella rhossiliensis]KAH0968708.1 hypothetical protein HRG_01350 [Hirsutella rhossiliensis]